MKEFQQIVNLIEDINQNHRHHLSYLSDEDKLLLVIKTQEGKTFPIKISKNGLEILKDRTSEEFKNVVEIALKDLIKLINHRSYILRYLMTGRIKVKGSVKKVLEILQTI